MGLLLPGYQRPGVPRAAGRARCACGLACACRGRSSRGALHSSPHLPACLLACPPALPPVRAPVSPGVSAVHDYDVNSLAVPRKAKEAIGAITRLTYPDGRCGRASARAQAPCARDAAQPPPALLPVLLSRASRPSTCPLPVRSVCCLAFSLAPPHPHLHTYTPTHSHAHAGPSPSTSSTTSWTRCCAPLSTPKAISTTPQAFRRCRVRALCLPGWPSAPGLLCLT